MVRNKWVVLIGCLVALACSFGPAYLFTLGIFAQPMALELGWSRTQQAAGFSAATLAVALFSMPWGAVIDRRGARPVLIAAAIGVPLILATFGLVTSFWLYILLAFVMGGVGAASNPPAVLSVLPGWFSRNLGFALSIASMGIGIGGVLLPIIAQRAEATLGWRGGFVALALVVGAIGLVNALALVRDAPASSAEPIVTEATEEASSGVSFAEAVRLPTYWLLVAVFTAIAALYWGTTSQIAPIMADRGYPAATTAFALSAMGVTMIVGRLLGAVLLDRMSAYWLGFAFFASDAIGCLMLTLPALGGSPVIAAAFLGLACGGEGDVMAYILERRYGRRAYGRLYGLGFGVYNLGALCGPIVFGYADDRWHTYAVAGAVFGAMGVAAALALLWLGRSAPRVRGYRVAQGAAAPVTG